LSLPSLADSSQLEPISDSDLRQLQAWNQTGRAYPELRADQLFEQQAANRLRQLAVTYADRSLTYEALLNKTNCLAARLQSLGVAPGAVVGICMDRSLELVIALLAVFKAGGAYLPLDPAFPSDRLAFMLQDASPLLVITESDLRGVLPTNGARLLYINEEEMSESLPSSSEAAMDDPAYVLYTSGTTGKPKGVKVTHRALTNLLTSVASDLQLKSSDVFLATTTISFDISAFEIFAPLISGARLVVAARDVSGDGERLAEAITQWGATFLQATPSGWRILLESGWTGCNSLKMLTAGEPLDRSLAQRLFDRGSELWNFYGPTEATIYATGCRITQELAKISIGKPLANNTALILDADKRRVPIGAVGELYIGGVGVAAGYLNRPQETTRKFISNLLGSEPGKTFYRTGDLARFLPNGDIECLGRSDHQIKLRGYRIELEEIEALLDRHSAVRRSIVKLFHLSEDDQRLIAFIVPANSSSIDAKALRDYVSHLVPAYMVPASFIQLDAFPLTPNRKVDRQALQLPLSYAQEQSKLEVHASSALSGTQQILLDCWKSALKLRKIGLDDNFYELGGHSLLAVRMVADIAVKLGRKIPVSWLVEAPTFRKFADRFHTVPDLSAGTLVAMQTEGSLPPLYLIHHRLGDILVYRAMANCFSPHRPVYGVQAPHDFLDRPQPYPLTTLASEYVREIVKRKVSGPLHLAGYSSGAVLAFEMARQLNESGHTVGLLALIDGEIGHQPSTSAAPAKHWKALVRKLYKVVFKFNDVFALGPKHFFVSRFIYYRLLWGVRNLETSSGPITESITLEQALLLSENTYRAEPYPGSALLLRFRDEAWKVGPNPLMGWHGLIRKGIDAVDVPGGHITGMNTARASHLADILKLHMERIEDSAVR
jgi:amino acid adenylation domain-containing protein